MPNITDTGYTMVNQTDEISLLHTYWSETGNIYKINIQIRNVIGKMECSDIED